MPIYAYRCEHCGHAQDVLQKISDPVLTTCPACGHETFRKQVTAAGFQLKGSGWYVTDFRGDGKKGGSKSTETDGGAKADAKPAGDGAAKGDTASTSTSDKPAAAPAPAPAAKSGGGDA
jgi:putative FmdB family regulatory protein